MKFEVIDLFCGAGGVTTGIENARYKRTKIANVIACINHDPIAIESHMANHKGVLHFTEDIKNFDVTRFPRWTPGAITCLWASLECTNFSKAKGGKPRDADSRTLANHMFRYLEYLKPDYFHVENVEEFEAWGPLDDEGKPISMDNGKYYKVWVNKVKAMGYSFDRRKINAADFGANTIRKRLFLCFQKEGLPVAWPQPTHTKTPNLYIKKSWKPVKECLDFSDEGNSIFTRKKPLSDRTLERIYAGLVKFIAGGKDETFILKYNSVNKKTGKHVPPSVNDPCPSISTQVRLGMITAIKAFISQYNSGSDNCRNKSINDPCNCVPTNNRFALISMSKAFIAKAFSGNPKGKVSSINKPAGAITTVDHHAKVEADFLYSYISDAPKSVDKVFYTLTTQPQHAKVHAEFLIKYHGNGKNILSVEETCSTLSTKDRLAKVGAQFFIDIQHSQGKRNQSIEEPLGSLLSVPKQKLVKVEKAFLMDPNYNNVGNDINEPSPTLMASRRHRYIVNPQYNSKGASIDSPSPTLIARMDKAPPYLLTAETGEVMIEIFKKDSDAMMKVKLFMAAYGIIDIKIRMLKVPELLKIQGFPKSYKLMGNQSDKKKFIGNSVVPVVAQRIIEALYAVNSENIMQKAA